MKKIQIDTNKVYKLLKVVVIMLSILLCLVIVDNLKLGYNEKDEEPITCDERIKTNQYLIKICKENGSNVKIKYFQDGKTIQSISCGGN